MVEFRKATIEDLEELVSLRIKFMCEMNNTETYDAELPKMLRTYFEESIPNETFVSWIALVDGTIVGTSGICFYTLPPTWKNHSGKTAYIMNMYTLQEYRKQGIAYKLFQKMIEEAKRKGSGMIYLHATEKGRPLYKKFGFEAKEDEMVYRIR